MYLLGSSEVVCCWAFAYPTRTYRQQGHDENQTRLRHHVAILHISWSIGRPSAEARAADFTWTRPRRERTLGGGNRSSRYRTTTDSRLSSWYRSRTGVAWRLQLLREQRSSRPPTDGRRSTEKCRCRRRATTTAKRLLGDDPSRAHVNHDGRPRHSVTCSYSDSRLASER